MGQNNSTLGDIISYRRSSLLQAGGTPAHVDVDCANVACRWRMLRQPGQPRRARLPGRTGGQPGRAGAGAAPRRRLCTGGKTPRQPSALQCLLWMAGMGTETWASAIAPASTPSQPLGRAGGRPETLHCADTIIIWPLRAT